MFNLFDFAERSLPRPGTADVVRGRPLCPCGYPYSDTLASANAHGRVALCSVLAWAALSSELRMR